MFGTVDIKPRPIRLAYLVDPSKADQVREAIRLSSSLWGGTTFPIIPVHTRMPATWRDRPLKAPKAKDVLSGYLDAFDPDVLVQLSGKIPDHVAARGLRVIRPEQIWEPLKTGAGQAPQFGVGLFDLLTELFAKHFRYKAKYPVKVVFPKLPKALSLFWASWFGEVPPTLMPSLRRDYFEPIEAEEPDFDPAKLGEYLGSNVLFPRRITSTGLELEGRSRFHHAYVYYMDATRIEDIIDFWNLRAMGKEVIPVPRQLEDHEPLKRLVTNFLKANRRHWPHNPKVCDTATLLRARSRTMEQVQEYAKSIRLSPPAGDTSTDGYFSIQHWYPRVWDEWARDKDDAVPARAYGKPQQSFELSDPPTLKFRFKPVRPSIVTDRVYLSEPTFANEISFRFYGASDYLAEVLPRNAGKHLLRAISGLVSLREEWRVGADGLIKLVASEITEEREIPLAETVMFAWLKDLGWTATPSPPGLIAKQIFRRLSGHPASLRNETFLGLLEHMNGGSVQQDGMPKKENKIRQERDRPVGEVKTRLAGSANLYEFVLERGIFKLGLRVSCPKCLRKSWFELSTLGDRVICPKCLEAFPAIGNVDSSTWSYKTTGPFSVPQYADGAYAVLLALDFLAGRSMSSLRTTAVPSFKAEGQGKQTLEADFALLWEETIYGERKDGVLFGECKTYAPFTKRDFDRARYLAKTFPGAVLAFCTLRKELTKKEIAGISRIAKAGRKYWKPERPINPVLVLTGTELLKYPGPPYCWDESTRRKFDRMVGLLGLSDATQQIYLGLSSWQAEWQEKWEQKRKRWQDRRGSAA
jgi:hypothetical protein